jgi:uncharacterized delta-60 repeat protein
MADKRDEPEDRGVVRLRAARAVLVLALAVGGLVASPASVGAEEHPALDYGTNGVAIPNAPDGGMDAGAMVMASDGSFRVITGQVVRRITPEGAVDLAFGNGGVFGEGGGFVFPHEFVPYGLDVSTAGVVVFGLDKRPNAAQTALVRTAMLIRLTPGGRPDERFGPGGVVTFPGTNQQVTDATIAPDGGIAYVQEDYHLHSGVEAPKLRRITAEGHPDATFGTVALDADGWTPTLALTADGKVLVSDNRFSDERFRRDGRIQRYRSNGTVDPSFGRNGTTTIPYTYAMGLEVSPKDGSILLPSSDYWGFAEPEVWRLRADGRIDLTFGAGGRARIPHMSYLSATDPIALLDGGSMAVIGSEGGWEERIVVLRPDGLIDPTFGRNGVLDTYETLGYDGIGAHGNRFFASFHYGMPGMRIAAYDVPPFDPTVPQVRTASTAGGTLSVTWDAPKAIAGDPVRTYRVVASNDGIAQFSTGTAADKRAATISGIGVMQNWYDVHVEARLASGTVLRGPAATHVSGPGEVRVPKAPGFRKVSWGDRYIAMAWRPPFADGGSPVVAYSLFAVEKSTGALARWRNVGPDQRAATLDGLVNGVAYEVRIVAWSAHGRGDVSEPYTFTPVAKGDEPSPPNLVWRVAARGGSTIAAAWSEPVEMGQPTAGFDVAVVVNGKLVKWVQAGESARFTTVTNVPQGKTEVYVFAHSATELGPLGDPIAIT